MTNSLALSLKIFVNIHESEMNLVLNILLHKVSANKTRDENKT